MVNLNAVGDGNNFNAIFVKFVRQILLAKHITATKKGLALKLHRRLGCIANFLPNQKGSIAPVENGGKFFSTTFISRLFFGQLAIQICGRKC